MASAGALPGGIPHGTNIGQTFGKDRRSPLLGAWNPAGRRDGFESCRGYVAEEKGSMIMRLIRAARAEKAAKAKQLPQPSAREQQATRKAKRTHGGGADN